MHMVKQVHVGQSVTLRSALGDITRTVAEISGDVVAVCRNEDYLRAKQKGLQPVTVGFPLTDVVSVGDQTEGRDTQH